MFSFFFFVLPFAPVQKNIFQTSIESRKVEIAEVPKKCGFINEKSFPPDTFTRFPLRFGSPPSPLPHFPRETGTLNTYIQQVYTYIGIGTIVYEKMAEEKNQTSILKIK